MKNHHTLINTCLILLGFLLIPHSAFGVTEFELTDLGITRGRIAFTFINAEEHDIYVLDLSENSIKPIVTSPEIDEYPVWSPDGTRLAFHSDMTGDREIYTVYADGSDLKRLTESSGKDQFPDWSPNGKQIVFASSRRHRGQNIFIINADGSGIQQLTKGKEVHNEPKWSPRGTEILYSTDEYWPGTDLKLYDLALKEKLTLTHGVNFFKRAAWHPDGSKFVFSYGDKREIDLWIQEKGSKPRRITKNPGREIDAVWLENGKALIYSGESTPGKKDNQLYLLNAKTGESKLLLTSPGAIRYPSWTEFPAPPTKPSSMTH